LNPVQILVAGRVWPGCVNFAQRPALFLFFEGVTSRYQPILRLNSDKGMAAKMRKRRIKATKPASESFRHSPFTIQTSDLSSNFQRTSATQLDCNTFGWECKCKNATVVFRVFGGRPGVVGFILLINPDGIESFSPAVATGRAGLSRLLVRRSLAEGGSFSEGGSAAKAGRSYPGWKEKFVNPERG
jgi:hypothetical protein